jgi:hypothetical protein
MSMETERHMPPRTEGERYERRDANVSTLLMFGAGLFVVIVVVFFAMKGVFDFFAISQKLGPPASPFEDVRVLPPQPRLQVYPRMDLKTYCEAEQKDLNSYGWVDEHNGVVRIPVERAMDLTLERGLPSRPAAAGSSAKSSAPGETGSRNSADVNGMRGPCAYVLESGSQPGRKE